MTAIAITGIGAVTPDGLSAPATAAALRAGIARIGPVMSSLVDGEAGTVGPATGGRAPLEWLEGGPTLEEWPGHERFGIEPPSPEHLLVEDGPDRLARMAAPAAVEAWRRAGSSEPRPANSVGLFVGFAEDEDPANQLAVIETIVHAFGSWQPGVREAIARGRASALLGLHRAAEEIRSGRITGALVGGVDSLIRPSVHAALAKAGMLKDLDENLQGILPGEGSAFIVLDASPNPERVLARLAGTGVAEEPTLRTQKPNQGEGLSTALRMARKGTPGLTARPLSICDLNGDRYRAHEWGFAQTRALADLSWKDEGPGTGETWHPADCLGDSGAGSCAICAVWAIEAIRLGYAITREVLLWGASDGSLRAAAFVVHA